MMVVPSTCTCSRCSFVHVHTTVMIVVPSTCTCSRCSFVHVHTTVMIVVPSTCTCTHYSNDVLSKKMALHQAQGMNVVKKKNTKSCV